MVGVRGREEKRNPQSRRVRERRVLDAIHINPWAGINIFAIATAPFLRSAKGVADPGLLIKLSYVEFQRKLS